MVSIQYIKTGAVAIASGTSFPPDPVEGDCFYRTDLNEFYIYDGTSWVRWEIETHASEHLAAGTDPLSLTNAEIAALAAIAYSKLNLALSIVNADVNAAAAIAASKLDLANVGQAIGNIGDGTNYAEFAADGELVLHGTARVVSHLRIDPQRLRLPAANFPAEGQKGVFPTLDFDRATEESAYLSDYVPFKKDSTEGIIVAVTWCSDAVATGTVVWGAEYRSIAEGEDVDGATETITCADATAGAGKKSKCVFANPIAAADIAHDDDMGIRFFRKAADGADTLDEDARMLGVDLHFISNRLGEAL